MLYLKTFNFNSVMDISVNYIFKKAPLVFYNIDLVFLFFRSVFFQNFSFLKFFFLNYLCALVFCVHICLREGVGTPGYEVTDDLAQPCECW